MCQISAAINFHCWWFFFNFSSKWTFQLNIIIYSADLWVQFRSCLFWKRYASCGNRYCQDQLTGKVCVMALGLSSLELQGICFRWHGSRRDIACDTCCAIMVWGDKISCSLIYILTAARPYPIWLSKIFLHYFFPWLRMMMAAQSS